ncbi:Spy/CpxP family protein refolding chaperone [Pseudoduganella namucuonensis]|uniref:Protein refolding chaperone Spy/CpxP family n=1 Tax=Pseudoduganella namucuonensis TaxID=1035707 RepID=A0A1I7HPF2_9BURK|nr:Spy/CpxP family protein refolding chaperone [Pseudoduganella namucuonensis]SFU62521.1 protein refolding chaperone Spy/CpxP family [Pseudoduganella namucuonensis]
MKIKNMTPLTVALAVALALPLATFAESTVESGDAGFGPGPGMHTPGGPGMPPPGAAPGMRGGHGVPGGPGGPDGQRPDGAGPQGAGPHGGPPPMFAPPPFMRGLALTESQQDKVFTILHGQAPYLREQQRNLHKAQEGLHQMSTVEKYEDAKAAALAQSAAQAMANLELARVRTEQKLLAVLTADQRKQLDQRMAELPPRAPRS